MLFDDGDSKVKRFAVNCKSREEYNEEVCEIEVRCEADVSGRRI